MKTDASTGISNSAIEMPAGKLQQTTAAVFLDRDGVLIEDRGYVSRVEDVVIFPWTALSLRMLSDTGYKLFVVTNQSGIGRGYYTVEDMGCVNRHIEEVLGRECVRFERIYFAPEAPDQPSRGRKPSPQFLFDARDEFGIDLKSSYMIGDKLTDIECGWNAGVARSILVRTGYGAEVERACRDKLRDALVVDDLYAAAVWILGQGGYRRADGRRSAPYAKEVCRGIPTDFHGEKAEPGK
ncbi:MAG: HAD family hydrolase [Verrucomicrobiota bacterium]|nr:HAD family hydrolase [Verrucomicrobiota bacterium]